MTTDANVALVRQAIFTALDERAWDFTNDEQRVDFADRVMSFVPAPSSSERASAETHPAGESACDGKEGYFTPYHSGHQWVCTDKNCSWRKQNAASATGDGEKTGSTRGGDESHKTVMYGTPGSGEKLPGSPAPAAPPSTAASGLSTAEADAVELAVFWANMPDGATDSLSNAGARRLARAYLALREVRPTIENTGPWACPTPSCQYPNTCRDAGCCIAARTERAKRSTETASRALFALGALSAIALSWIATHGKRDENGLCGYSLKQYEEVQALDKEIHAALSGKGGQRWLRRR